MTLIYRLGRFARNARVLWRHRLVTRHNLRAAWIQSDPFWRERFVDWDISEDELVRFISALEEA